MPKAEFGIIDNLDPQKDYSEYAPDKYHCLSIDDDYLDEWWPHLCTMRTYFHSMSRPETALARWGVTLIPPESLPVLVKVLQTDTRMEADPQLELLLSKVEEAIVSDKYMIHFGVSVHRGKQSILGGSLMLEVVFSDSTKGAMRVAKSYSKEDILRGAFGYIGEGDGPSKEELEKLYDGQPLGGSPEDVVCIGCNFDIGNISGEIDGIERREEFVRVFGYVSFEKDEIDRFFVSQLKDMEKLLSAAKRGEQIRVWTSNIPYTACGFAFLCDLLLDIDCEVSLVCIPNNKTALDSEGNPYSDWAGVPPGQFYRFLPLEKTLSAEEKKIQSNTWRALKKENAPLRALINGKLQSVQEDFYDDIILCNIPSGEFIMARLIGNILGKYPIGIGDGWYALRIRKLINDRILKIVGDEDPSHPYGKILCRV